MSQQIDWQKLTEIERKKLIQKGQLEIDEMKRKIDEKQKLLCEKRETIPTQCENLLIAERIKYLEYFSEGEVFVPGPQKPNLDSQLVIDEIQNQLRVDEKDTITENELLEDTKKKNEEAEKINMKCIELAEKLLRMPV